MADEVIINTGDHGAVTSVDVALGDVIVMGSDGQWDLAADGATSWWVALGPGVAADGDRVTGVKERVMKVKVDGTIDIAIGNELYVGDSGALYSDSNTGARALAGAVALEAFTTDGTGLIKVLVS